jgi:putative flippase GtrA
MLTKVMTALRADRETRNKMLRYLFVGGANTAFGYLATVGLYYALRPHLHIVVIGALANVVCITEAFITYKLFVFNTRNGWIREYLRCYVVYGGSAVIGIAGLWLLVNILGVPFWLAQGLLMVVSVVVSYTGHDRFTFRKAQRG